MKVLPFYLRGTLNLYKQKAFAHLSFQHPRAQFNLSDAPSLCDILKIVPCSKLFIRTAISF
jgi:hypothetical protein